MYAAPSPAFAVRCITCTCGSAAASRSANAPVPSGLPSSTTSACASGTETRSRLTIGSMLSTSLYVGMTTSARLPSMAVIASLRSGRCPSYGLLLPVLVLRLTTAAPTRQQRNHPQRPDRDNRADTRRGEQPFRQLTDPGGQRGAGLNGYWAIQYGGCEDARFLEDLPVRGNYRTDAAGRGHQVGPVVLDRSDPGDRHLLRALG